MESDMSWEQNAVLNELIQGMEIARKLKADLRLPTSVDTRNLLVQRILSSYDKALLILRWNGSIPKSQTMHQATKTSSPLSPLEGGLKVKDHQELKRDSKKRKMMPKWMDQVIIKVENGFEGTHEDGYKWRKYGQKDILDAKYPRCYYRCTYRNTKGCLAKKQVQISDEDPTILNITYQGKHTCSPKSPNIKEKPHGNNNDDVHNAQTSQEILTKFRNMLAVNTENLGIEEKAYPFPSPPTSSECMTQDNDTLFPSVMENDPFLLSPETPQSNIFQSHAFLVDELNGVSTKPFPDFDVNEIITTNFPILDFNFSLDAVKID